MTEPLNPARAKKGKDAPSAAEPAKPIPLQNIETLQVPDSKFGMSFLLLGSTRSGKSTLVNYLFERYFKKHISILMSNSLQSDAYKPLLKKCVVSDLYHPEVLKDLYMINHSTKNHYPFLVILDDLTHVRNDKQYQRLLTIYRNSRISCLIVAQSSSIMNASGRTNINFVCLFKLNSDEEIEKVIKKYLISRFPTSMKMADKIRFYRQATEDHHFFFIDNFTGNVCLTKISV